MTTPFCVDLLGATQHMGHRDCGFAVASRWLPWWLLISPSQLGVPHSTVLQMKVLTARVRCHCTKGLSYAPDVIQIRLSILSLQRHGPLRPRLRQRWVADGNKKGIIVENVDPRCISRGLQFDKHNIVRTSVVGTRHIGLLFRLTEGKGRRCIGYAGRFDGRLRAGEWYRLWPVSTVRSGRR